MSKNKLGKENARAEGNVRSKAWRNLTYAEQRQKMQMEFHWGSVVNGQLKLTKQAAKIVANAEKHGWDKKPIDYQTFDQPKKAKTSSERWIPCAEELLESSAAEANFRGPFPE